jgi:hypothetical protein
MYVEMMTDFEKLRDSLREYGKGYIFVTDYNLNELRVKDSSCKDGYKSFKSSDVTRNNGMGTRKRNGARIVGRTTKRIPEAEKWGDGPHFHPRVPSKLRGDRSTFRDSQTSVKVVNINIRNVNTKCCKLLK